MSAETAIVIGGGAAGSSCALHLAESGIRDIHVLERSHPGEGSSGLSMGVFTRAYTKPLDVALRAYCFDYIAGLEADGLHTTRTGYLRLAHDDETIEEYERGVRLNHELGQSDVTVLDAKAIQARFPHVRTDDLTGGLWAPRDGHLDGTQLCAAYMERAARLGVKLHARTEVTGVHGGDGAPFVVTTSRGTFTSDVIVNAAGPWAGHVGDLLGTPLPMHPERHQVGVFHLPTPLSYEMPYVMDYVPGAAGEGLFFRSENSTTLLAGLHTNDRLGGDADPDDYFAGIDESYVEQLFMQLLERLPALEDMGLQGGWSGLYPLTSDSRPIIGRTQRDGVYVCVGLGAVGVYTSPIMGRLLADAVLDVAMPTVDTGGAFEFDRFAG